MKKQKFKRPRNIYKEALRLIVSELIAFELGATNALAINQNGFIKVDFNGLRAALNLPKIGIEPDEFSWPLHKAMEAGQGVINDMCICVTTK